MKKKSGNSSNSAAGTLKENPAPYRTASSAEFYPLQTPEDQGWIDFRDQCRRQMKRPLADRLKYGFARRMKPLSGKTASRAFKTMAEYRAWCASNMPAYLGFKRPSK